MTEIEALLTRRKELDLTAWEKWVESCGITPRPWRDMAFLQAVVQEAIAARVGWGYSVDCLGIRDDECRYCGLIVGPNTETDDLEDGWIRVEEASTPAAAILAAYIKALEARR